jgi:hypothetical protein
VGENVEQFRWVDLRNRSLNQLVAAGSAGTWSTPVISRRRRTALPVSVVPPVIGPAAARSVLVVPTLRPVHTQLSPVHFITVQIADRAHRRCFVFILAESVTLRLPGFLVFHQPVNKHNTGQARVHVAGSQRGLPGSAHLNCTMVPTSLKITCSF